jgi:hypothetical protein
VSRLQNFSRRRIRLTEQSSTVATPGATIRVSLPSEVVDLSSVALFFKLTTSTTAGACGVGHCEHLIDSYQIVSGGQALTSSFQFNDVWNMFSDYQLADKKSLRKLLSTKAAGAPTNLTAEPCAIYSMLGFFNSASPRCLDFGLFPKTDLVLRLANTDVLLKTADAATASYYISEFYVECDVVQLPDIYYQSMQAYIQSNAIEIPFTNYITFQTGSGSLPGLTSQFNVSSQSVDAIIPTVYTVANHGSNVWDSDTENNARFRRGAAELTGVQVRINNVQMCPWGEATPDRSAFAVINELAGGADDTVGSAHAGMSSLALFKSKFYAHPLRLNHKDAAYGSALISGMNTLNNPANVLISYSASSAVDAIPFTTVVSTASILVASGKQVELRQ